MYTDLNIILYILQKQVFIEYLLLVKNYLKNIFFLKIKIKKFLIR